MQKLLTLTTVAALAAGASFAGADSSNPNRGADGFSLNGFAAADYYNDDYYNDTYFYSNLNLRYKATSGSVSYGAGGILDIYADGDYNETDFYPRVFVKSGGVRFTLGHAENAAEAVDRRTIGYLGAWEDQKYVSTKLARLDYRKDGFRASLSVDEDDWAGLGLSYKAGDTKFYGGLAGYTDDLSGGYRFVGLRHKLSDQLKVGGRIETGYGNRVTLGGEYSLNDKLTLGAYAERYSNGSSWTEAGLGASYAINDNFRFYGTAKNWSGDSDGNAIEIGATYRFRSLGFGQQEEPLPTVGF